MTLHLDFETRSHVNLKVVGVYRYVTDPSTDIWCAAYAVDDAEVSLWVPGDPVPGPIAEHVARGGSIHAHNAQFERLVWWFILATRYGFKRPRLEQFFCTAAEAAAMALPRSLEKVAQVLGVEEQKDMAGRAVILQLSRPTKKGGWVTDPEKIQKLYDACKQDVRTERAVAAKLRPLPPSEREVYLFDQRINDRGVPIDLALVAAMDRIVDDSLFAANDALAELTGGAVTKVSQSGRLVAWLKQQGVETDTVSRPALQALAPAATANVAQAIKLRMESGRTSLAKLKRIPDLVNKDGRVRGTLLYHGASTGRWAAKLLQTHNFPRGEVKGVERYIPYVLAGNLEEIDRPPLVVLSSLLRSIIAAPPGKIFRSADFSQIEARIVAWIAEQDDLVAAFAQGAKIYERMAAHVYGMDVDDVVDGSVQRHVGKGLVLGCGFGMGAPKFQATMAKLGIMLADDEAAAAVEGYRTMNRRIVEFWKRINDASYAAVAEPGRVTRTGRRHEIAFSCGGGILWCRLPSGRMLSYVRPEIVQRETKFGVRSIVEYSTVSSQTKQWVRRAMYGGLLTENVVQAMARDVMVSAMQRVERNGYPVILTVHDEVVTETPAGSGDLTTYLALMRRRPRWAHDLPIAVSGWEGERYKK